MSEKSPTSIPYLAVGHPLTTCITLIKRDGVNGVVQKNY